MTIFTTNGGESNPGRLHRMLVLNNARHHRHFLRSPNTQIAYKLPMLGFALLSANLPVVVHELAVKPGGQKNHLHRHPASCADLFFYFLVFCFQVTADHRHP